MLEHIRKFRELIVVVLTWVVLGNINTELAMGGVILSTLLFMRANRYAELIIGFAVLLVFSDSLLVSLAFAKKVKDIYLVLLAVYLLFDKSLTRRKNPIFLNFLPFLLWAACLIPFSPVPDISLQKTLSYALIILVAPYYFMKLLDDQGLDYVKSYLWAVTIVLISGFILGFVDFEKGYLLGRFRGLFGNPNGIGVFCAMITLLMATAWNRFPARFTLSELVWVGGLIALSVFLSGSRNSLISIFVFFLFLRTYRVSKWFGFTTFILTVVLYEIIISNLPAVLNYFGLAHALRAESLESGSGRFIAWAFAFKILNSDVYQFFFGKGIAFEEYIFGKYQEQLISMGHIGGVHNSFLALWLNTGIVGLILWMYGFFKTIIRIARKSYIAMPIVYTIFFSAFFEPWLMGSLNPYTIQVLFILSFLIFYNSPPPVRGTLKPLEDAEILDVPEGA